MILLSKEQIIKVFESINQKLDSLVLESSADLEKDVKEIKQLLSSQGQILNKIEDLEESEDLPEIADLGEVKEDIESAIQKFEDKLDTFANAPQGEISTGNIQDELNSFKSELLKNLIVPIINSKFPTKKMAPMPLS